MVGMYPVYHGGVCTPCICLPPYTTPGTPPYPPTVPQYPAPLADMSRSGASSWCYRTNS